MRVTRSVYLVAAIPIACVVAILLPGTAGAVTKSCGSAHIAKPSGGYWTCAFGDNFAGKRLKSRNWRAMNTTTMGWSQAGECYVNDPSHVRVHRGHLTLTATRLESSKRCGPFRSRYESGMIFTKGRFAQAYGRFTVRAKFPSGTGFQSAFWMWPRDMTYGRGSGEIDVAEAYGDYPDYVSPHIHLLGFLGIKQSQGTYCDVADSSGTFHKYTVIWLPTSLRFVYDGVTCLDIPTWTPGAPLVAPQPFDKPFFMLLQLALGYARNTPVASSPFPARFVVDYVRAWR